MQYSNKRILSVIIPAYNEEASLPFTLEKLADRFNENGDPIDQSLYRIIVVNNNSTDGTGKVVAEFKDRKDVPQCILVNEKEKGMGTSKDRRSKVCT